MTEDKTTRLTHILAMTTSPYDAEALTAVRLAQRFMQQHKINWQDVVEGRGMPDSRGAIREAYEKGYAEGYAKGVITGKGASRPRPASWRAITEDMLARDDELTDWERQFLTGFLYRRWHTPTERQRSVFERVADKLDMELPDAQEPADEPPW